MAFTAGIFTGSIVALALLIGFVYIYGAKIEAKKARLEKELASANYKNLSLEEKKQVALNNLKNLADSLKEINGEKSKGLQSSSKIIFKEEVTLSDPSGGLIKSILGFDPHGKPEEFCAIFKEETGFSTSPYEMNQLDNKRKIFFVKDEKGEVLGFLTFWNASA